MKKSYLLIAAAGLIMAACSQEDDFVAQNQTAAGQNDGAVLFDTYLSNTSTRAGQTGTMTTKTLQNTGFGIIAFQSDGSKGEDGYTDITSSPNFMWNQYVGYISSNWTYSPLKYWPNETDNDQQKPTGYEANAADDKVDKISFFAYAPYVNATAGTGAVTDEPTAMGITTLSANTAIGDPTVTYKVADGSAATAYASKSVDLLWGTSSGFSYHPVRTGSIIDTEAGKPVIDMEKPALDEKVKFDFKHALARIGMTVVGAFDQVAQGGSKDAATRITIKEIEVSSDDAFATGGVLNLNNTVKDRANWGDFTYSGSGTKSSFKIDNADANEMNPNLRYGYGVSAKEFPKVGGVASTEQNVILSETPWNDETIAAKTKEYKESDGFFTGAGAVKTPVATTDLEYGTVTNRYLYLKSGSTYYISSTAPAVADAMTKTVRDIALSAKLTGTKAALTDESATKTYLKQPSKTGTDYTVVAYGDLPDDLDAAADAYYTIMTDDLTGDNVVKLYYKAATYYAVKTTPGYFMVIPTTGDTPANKEITVKITYYVTTKDDNLEDGTSEIENIISQKVTLNGFTNGKAYNLKLILGLTSVKVDAEVSNWEVGTVESNLPQNLE